MSRSSRVYSCSGYYHIVVKGVSDQVLFEGKTDYEYFLRLMQKNCMETDVKICAYCLMSNHGHLLLYAPDQTVTLFMKKINVSYSLYFNKRYERNGHLFQNRFFSAALETEAAFVSAYKYILINPEKAGIGKTEEYSWSSYSLYEKNDSIIDNSMAYSLIGTKDDLDDLLRSEDCTGAENYLYKKDDAWAIRTANDLLGYHCSRVCSLDKETRDNAIRLLKKTGMSVRQISRITGVSRGIVQRR